MEQLEEYSSLTLGIAHHDSPEGEVPVFYMTAKRFYYLGSAQGKGDADRLGRRHANAMVEVNQTYVDGFPYAFLSNATSKATGDLLAIVLH